MKKPEHNQPDPEMIDEDNPEWTDEMFKTAIRIRDLPEALQKKLRRPGERGPQHAPKKVQTAIRYDASILEHFKAAGPGWQTRINDTLKKAIEMGLA
ncbi:BrnA antitoxin family protein [Alcaligenaceae bacterium CGII-47]|nr:BrnA antitoxin family protein [Alcaligenaceae bacterium CGII-47]